MLLAERCWLTVLRAHHLLCRLVLAQHQYDASKQPPEGNGPAKGVAAAPTGHTINPIHLIPHWLDSLLVAGVPSALCGAL